MGSGASQDNVEPIDRQHGGRRSIANNTSQAGSVITSTYHPTALLKQPLHATVLDVNHNISLHFCTSVKGAQQYGSPHPTPPTSKGAAAALPQLTTSSSNSLHTPQEQRGAPKSPMNGALKQSSPQLTFAATQKANGKVGPSPYEPSLGIVIDVNNLGIGDAEDVDAEPSRLSFHPLSNEETSQRLMHFFGTPTSTQHANNNDGNTASHHQQHAGVSLPLASRLLRQLEEHGEPPAFAVWRGMQDTGNNKKSGAAAAATAASSSSLYATQVPLAAPSNFMLTSIGGQSGPIRALSSSVDGSQCCVLVQGRNCINFTDAVGGNSLLSIRGTGDELLSCAMSRDGKFVLSTSKGGTATMYDLNNGKRIRDIRFQTDTIVPLCALSDDSEWVATTSLQEPGHILIYDGKGIDVVRTDTKHRQAITALCFTRKEAKWIASGSEDGEVRVWRPIPETVQSPPGSPTATTKHHRGGRESPSLPSLAPPPPDLFQRRDCHRLPIKAVSISNDNRRLLSLDDSLLCVWDLFLGSVVFTRHAGENGAIRFGPSNDTAKLFAPNATTTSPSASSKLIKYTTATFTAGGFLLFATTDKSIVAISSNDGSELFTCFAKAPVVAIGVSWHADILLLGDDMGNQYRLALLFSERDKQLFGLDRKAAIKEKGRID